MFSSSSTLLRRAVPSLRRAASTAPPRGLAAILQKNPEDVVITFAKRTPVGRARKGQLKDNPVDEILQALFVVCVTIMFYCNESNESSLGYP